MASSTRVCSTASETSGCFARCRTLDDRTEVVVAVPAAGHPAPRELADEIARAIAGAGGPPSALELVDMTEAEETGAVREAP